MTFCSSLRASIGISFLIRTLPASNSTSWAKAQLSSAEASNLRSSILPYSAHSILLSMFPHFDSASRYFRTSIPPLDIPHTRFRTSGSITEASGVEPPNRWVDSTASGVESPNSWIRLHSFGFRTSAYLGVESHRSLALSQGFSMPTFRTLDLDGLIDQ